MTNTVHTTPQDLRVQASAHDFSGVHAAMRRYVDADILSGVSHAVLRGRDIIDLGCTGWADKEAGVPLRTDHLFRAMSNTKLVVSCAALLLLEEGRFELDEPIDALVPQLARRHVLRPGATSLADTEPARGPITFRHLFSHSSGLSYGLLDPGTLLYQAYTERKMLSPWRTLTEMMDALADLPLMFHPGTGWEYSVATDVLGHLVEVLSRQRLDAFMRQRIFAPLGMVDTGFLVPPEQQHRLAAYYAGADVLQPMKPGLTPLTDSPYPGAYLQPFARLSGGGGLVTSLPDMVALIRGLTPDPSSATRTLLKPETLALMMSNQLPADVNIRFAQTGEVPDRGYGLAGCVTLKPTALDPPGSTGEFQWGGLAGTHWWMLPKANLAGLLMTQRQFGFWNPYAFEFKQRVYAAVGA